MCMEKIYDDSLNYIKRRFWKTVIIRTLKAVESRFWLLALLFTVFQMVLVSTSVETLHQEGRVFFLEVKKNLVFCFL